VALLAGLVACGDDAPIQIEAIPVDGGQAVLPTAPGLRAFIDADLHLRWPIDGRLRVSPGYREAMTEGAFPMDVGAMAVLELGEGDGDSVDLDVALKIVAGSGEATWLWWRRRGGSTSAGVGNQACMQCHATAVARDYSLSFAR